MSDPRRHRVDPTGCRRRLGGTPLEPWIDALLGAVEADEGRRVHGDLPRWRAALDALPVPASNPDPDMPSVRLVLDEPVVALDWPAGAAPDPDALRAALAGLRPWRKGPFRFADVSIDAEWRSDRKWDRVAPHLTPLRGRTVLDVGSGSGYHLWRMRGADAACVLGIEPMILYDLQFEAFARHAAGEPVCSLPLTLERLPADMRAFDTVFSMGVLYHRRDPDAHLGELRAALVPGGELLLETLVVGTADDAYPLDGRYARMRNVHALPGVARVARWLREAGFVEVRAVSLDVTATGEQRRTAWMGGDSLAEALDPADDRLTVEGHPRPCRVAFVAKTS